MEFLCSFFRGHIAGKSVAVIIIIKFFFLRYGPHQSSCDCISQILLAFSSAAYMLTLVLVDYFHLVFFGLKKNKCSAVFQVAQRKTMTRSVTSAVLQRILMKINVWKNAWHQRR